MKSIQELEKEKEVAMNCIRYEPEEKKRCYKCLFCGNNFTGRGIHKHLHQTHGIIRHDFGIRDSKIETLKEVLKLIDNFNWFEEGVEWEDILGRFKRLISEGERT